MTSFCASPLLLQNPASSKASAMLQQSDGGAFRKRCSQGTGCQSGQMGCLERFNYLHTCLYVALAQHHPRLKPQRAL